jgi:hypothetical protein
MNPFNEKNDTIADMHSDAKSIISNIDSRESIVYASSVEEFFYENTDQPVEQGEPVGVNLWVGNNKILSSDKYKNPQCDLVLFKNIYWRQSDE